MCSVPYRDHAFQWLLSGQHWDNRVWWESATGRRETLIHWLCCWLCRTPVSNTWLYDFFYLLDSPYQSVSMSLCIETNGHFFILIRGEIVCAVDILIFLIQCWLWTVTPCTTTREAWQYHALTRMTEVEEEKCFLLNLGLFYCTNMIYPVTFRTVHIIFTTHTPTGTF